MTARVHHWHFRKPRYLTVRFGVQCFFAGAVVPSLLALGALLAPGRAQAQGLGYGILEGFVVDSASRGVPTSTITLVNLRTGRQQLLRSSRNGRFTTEFVPPGRYQALVERIGFVPQRVDEILVQPGQRVRLLVTLARSSGEGGPQGATRSQAAGVVDAPPQHWLTSRGAAPLPFDGLSVSAVALLSSRAGPALDVEGLPASMTTLVVDGVPSLQPGGEIGTIARTSGLALSNFDLVDLLTVAPDVEWPGAAAAYITAFTRQGSPRPSGQLFGDWSGDALGGASSAAPFQSYRVGGQIGGSISGDTAHFMLGAEFLQSELPFQSLWAADAETARLVDEARSRYDLDLDRYAQPTIGRVERVSAFGRLDLRLGRSNDLSIRANAAVLPRIDPILPREGLLLGPGSSPDARDVLASATLTSRVAERMMNELNASFELGRTRRTPDTSDPLALDLPSTIVATAGRGFGWPDVASQSSELTGFYVRETLHDVRGNHRLKYGASGAFTLYKLGFQRGSAGEFLFPSVDDFLERRGTFRRIEGPGPTADFDLKHYTFFVQDTWTASPDLTVTLGLRYAMTRLPNFRDIPLDFAWRDLTGLANNTVPERPGHVEPLVALKWAPGGGRDWSFRASATVDGQMLAPELMGELYSNSGGLDVFAGIGDLGSWPAPPSVAIAPLQGKTLSMFGPKFRGPETTRIAGSLSRNLADVATLTVSGTARATSFLPRRRDINLLPRPTAVDQHGRPVYGELVKVGGLVAPRPGSNRRIVEYDRVWAIEAAGYSEYRSMGVSLQRPLSAGVALLAAYTFSKTEDDWIIGNGRDPESQLTPFPDSLDGVDWVDGRSDLDVPHRFTFGAELKVPGTFGPRVAALYRVQSGYPFTPGFRDGVDVNADGASNDPAFIDNTIPGAAELVAAWPCLQSQIGRFAERNSCRGPKLHGLDARLGVDIIQSERYTAQIILDALNLLSSDAGVVDRAVYLIDPAANLNVDPNAGRIGIPLIVNPEFGQLRTRYSAQRSIRLGVRVSY
jgi:hypothetical protein